MKNSYLKYLIPSLAILVIDIFWLNFVMANPYKKMIKQIQGSEMVPNYPYAIAAYLLVVLLLTFIIIKHDLPLFDSFVVGICAWGLYDFTTGTVIKNWRLDLALLDVLWGGLLLMSMKYLSDQFK